MNDYVFYLETGKLFLYVCSRGFFSYTLITGERRKRLIDEERIKEATVSVYVSIEFCTFGKQKS